MTSPSVDTLPGLPQPYITDGTARPTQLVRDPAADVVAVVGNFNSSATASSIAVTLTAGVPVGETALLAAMYRSNTAAITSVVDNKGNTYRLGINASRSSTVWMGSYAAKVTTALVAGDVITVTLSASATRRALNVCRVAGMLDADPIAGAGATSPTTISQSVPITTPSAALLQTVEYVDGSFTYDPIDLGFVFRTPETASTVTSYRHLTRAVEPGDYDGGGNVNDNAQQKITRTLAWALNTVPASTANPVAHDDTIGLFGTTYDDQVLGLGPVNYWKMDEASGTAIVDSVGSKNGVLQSLGTNASRPSVGLVTGASRSVLFTGVTTGTRGRVTFPVDPTPLPVLSAFAWCEPVNNRVNFEVLFSRRTNGGGWAAAIDATLIRWYLGAKNVLGTTSLGLSIGGGVPVPSMGAGSHFVGFTYDGSIIKLYADGLFLLSGVVVDLDSSAPFVIGDANTFADPPWLGRISHMTLFDYVLSEEQVQRLWQRGKGYL